MVADACEMMLKDSTAAEQLARENRSLAEKIRDWLREWVENLKIALEGLQADRTESKAMMQYAQELQKIWDNALVDAARNNRGTESKTRYSYSGVRAKTANRSALQKAIEMRDQKESNEEIRKETGWFVGMDGKWRFEISDADIKFDADGKLRDSEFYVKTLADYMSHEKLFEAYPDLAEVVVNFEKLEKGERGKYIRSLDEIELGQSLLNDPKELLDTLVHEVQHAIQERERFSPGSSPAYWNRRLEEGADVRTRKERLEEERLRKELDKMKESDPEFVADMEKLNKMAPSVSRGAINWDTLEQIEPDPPEWVVFDKERDRLEEKYGDRVFDWFALRDQIDMNKKKQSRMPSELYYNTAGEIEARDSAARRMLTDAQRKEKAPDLGDENTVFADNTVAFYAKDARGSKTASVKEQLKESRDTLNRLPPVTSKTVLEDIEKLSAAQRYEWAVKELKASGYRVERVDGSVITFEPKDINSGLRYLNTAGEIAAYTALPAVLKRGIAIHENPNHKGRGYGTVTYAAPVEINGVRGNMAVVVRQTNGNRYDVHRIVMPDGAAFEFKKKANAVPTSAGGITDIAKASGEVNPAINTASKSSIRQTAADSQEKSSDNKTPTADPDIRYQQRDNLKEEYHLTDDEESAIISYKAGDSYTLNGKLTARAELTEYQRKLRDNLDAALEKLPVYRGEVYRHYNFDDFGGFDAMRDFLSLFKNGRHIELGGYLSCSTVRNEDRTQGKYTVNMVVQSDNGRRLAGFGRNTENEILLPRDTQLVPYRMERMGPTSIRIYVREETISETGKTDDSALPGVLQMREGAQGGKDLRQVSGGDPGKVQSEVGRSAGRDGDRGEVPGLREGEGSGALDPSGVAENYGRTGTRGGEGEKIKNQQRDPRLSDRDVLRMAADMALSDRKMNFTQADRERLKIFKKRLDILDEKQTQRQGYLQTKRDILSNSARLF